ncbi:MAG: V-type ATP synthase subunit D [Phycisphaerae bacterium]|jgi:V/A-type H+-transporting ATPase subunit D|nr:V-type ATP synthase subunit D [Phycisphaerae bacterium]
MATKIKLTRPELKRYRDAMHRYTRFLPMLKLKQQQLQVTIRDVEHQRRAVEEEVRKATRVIEQYSGLFGDLAGVNVKSLAEPEEVLTSTTNIAGVALPVFEDVTFGAVSYSLFGTPAWVDRAVADLQEINRHEAHRNVLQKQYELLSAELVRIIQRVNLFEKIKIPEAKNAIRVIRIKLGDEMASAVGRAKIAKTKLANATSGDAVDLSPMVDHEEEARES